MQQWIVADLLESSLEFPAKFAVEAGSLAGVVLKSFRQLSLGVRVECGGLHG